MLPAPCKLLVCSALEVLMVSIYHSFFCFFCNESVGSAIVFQTSSFVCRTK